MSPYIGPCTACGASVVRTGAPHLCRLCEAAQLVDAMARALEHEGHPTRLIPGRGRVVPDATVARVLGLTPDAVAKVRKRGLSPSVREDWMARWVARGGEELCHNRAEALAARARADWTPPKRLTANERLWTPPEFADVLLEMARSVSPQMSLVRPCSGD